MEKQTYFKPVITLLNVAADDVITASPTAENDRDKTWSDGYDF